MSTSKPYFLLQKKKDLTTFRTENKEKIELLKIAKKIHREFGLASDKFLQLSENELELYLAALTEDNDNDSNETYSDDEVWVNCDYDE